MNQRDASSNLVLHPRKKTMKNKNVFYASDMHFGHANICKFMNADGTKVRPWDDVQEMDEVLVQNWNSVVKPSDKVYVLGDVVMNRKHLPTLGRLNGDKVLIKGNHDIFDNSDYMKYFRDIRAYHATKRMIMSHVPIHPASLYRWPVNLHGHLHSEVVQIEQSGAMVPDKRYFNVSMERIDFTPIAQEDLFKLIDA